ncbi:MULTISPECIES: hypothetical protein [unclassified Streptomyces]|uniref:hypothetical protein n=1 Tax=unclassified Streptomyces TaxID=2593676 RepID=UPI002E2CA05A|nr:hypothetical protein [Streptomyces sp. NBC_00223]
MTSLMNTKLTDRSVIAASAFGISLRGTGLSVLSALLPVMPVSERDERPTQAPAVAAAAAQAQAYAFAAAAYGAGAGTAKGATAANGHANGRQKTQHGMKWAFRGLEPWSDPA